MWSTDGLNRDPAKLKLAVGTEEAYISQFTEWVPVEGSLICLLRNIERQTVFSLVDPCMPDMVPVVVGDYQGVDLPDIAAMGGKPCLSLFAVDTGIEKQPDAAGLNVDTVAVAA